jgi:hypothetical protein
LLNTLDDPRVPVVEMIKRVSVENVNPGHGYQNRADPVFPGKLDSLSARSPDHSQTRPLGPALVGVSTHGGPAWSPDGDAPCPRGLSWALCWCSV